MGFDAKLVFVRSASPVSDVTAVEVPAASLMTGDVVGTYDPVTGGGGLSRSSCPWTPRTGAQMSWTGARSPASTSPTRCRW